MSLTFKAAKRENIALLIGLAGGTGSGKTFSAMRLAKGMAEGKRFAVIDTENGRASHYADQFDFDVADLREPFSPVAYLEAIKAADKAGYSVIVVDSMSHEWAGTGGVLDAQENELDRMAGQDWKKREACRMAAWIRPKMEHKHMVQSLLQVKAHVILCFRAEEKIEIVKEDGKTKIVPKQSLTGLNGWISITEKNLPFELTTSILFTADRPGIPQPIKLQEQHKALFPLDRVVDEQSGKRIAEWAAGGAVKRSVEVPPVSASTPAQSEEKQDVDTLSFVTADQATYIGDLLAKYPKVKDAIVKKYGSIAKIPADAYHTAVDWIEESTGGK